MFLKIPNGAACIPVEALINLRFIRRITCHPYESGHQLLAHFPNNCGPLNCLADEREKVVILKGPCTKEFAYIQQRKLLNDGPVNDRFVHSLDDVEIDLHKIASVVKWYDDKRNAFRVTAHVAFGVQKSPYPHGIVALGYPNSKSRADDVFGTFAFTCRAIELEID